MMNNTLQVHESPWDPDSTACTLNVALDGCIVPSESLGARVDKAHVVVLDDFVSPSDRKELLDWITEPGKLLPVGHQCACRNQQDVRLSSASS